MCMRMCSHVILQLVIAQPLVRFGAVCQQERGWQKSAGAACRVHGRQLPRPEFGQPWGAWWLRRLPSHLLCRLFMGNMLTGECSVRLSWGMTSLPAASATATSAAHNSCSSSAPSLALLVLAGTIPVAWGAPTAFLILKALNVTANPNLCGPVPGKLKGITVSWLLPMLTCHCSPLFRDPRHSGLPGPPAWGLHAVSACEGSFSAEGQQGAQGLVLRLCPPCRAVLRGSAVRWYHPVCQRITVGAGLEFQPGVRCSVGPATPRGDTSSAQPLPPASLISSCCGRQPQPCAAVFVLPLGHRV